jgi:hypothetical protein
MQFPVELISHEDTVSPPISTKYPSYADALADVSMMENIPVAEHTSTLEASLG